MLGVWLALYSSLSVFAEFFLCSELAEQYGNDIASEILAKSRSGWHVDGLPAMAYSQDLSKAPSVQKMMAKLDTIGNKGE